MTPPPGRRWGGGGGGHFIICLDEALVYNSAPNGSGVGPSCWGFTRPPNRNIRGPSAQEGTRIGAPIRARKEARTGRHNHASSMVPMNAPEARSAPFGRLCGASVSGGRLDTTAPNAPHTLHRHSVHTLAHIHTFEPGFHIRFPFHTRARASFTAFSGPYDFGTIDRFIVPQWRQSDKLVEFMRQNGFPLRGQCDLLDYSRRPSVGGQVNSLLAVRGEDVRKNGRTGAAIGRRGHGTSRAVCPLGRDGRTEKLE